MSTPKLLAEVMLRVMNAMRELPLHERVAVLAMAHTLLQAEAKSLELEARPQVNDEHYRTQ